jgi:hypothetical protein
MSYKVVDPLAQSFLIEEPCVITKAEVFFKTKDPTLPMLCQIRENENGVPGRYIVPMSDKFVYPNNISTSTDGSLPTSIKFDSPIFLKPGEYSICLGSDSKRYQVYVSELDGTDLITNKRIVKQPYMGSLFKSQNSTTWTPEQLQDLKFNLYRAKFDTSGTGNIDFNIRSDSFKEVVLDQDPLEVFNGSTNMRVYHFNHGMTEESYVKIAGIAEVDALMGTVGSVFGVSFTNILNTPVQISNVTINGYTITLPTAANQNARFGGSRVTASRNLVVNALYPVEAKIEQSTTEIKHQFKGTLTDYTQDAAYVTLERGTTELPKTRIIANPTTKAENLSGAESFSYRINMTSANSLLSPMIDQNQLGLLTAQNLINNPDYDTENPLAEDVLAFITSAASVTFTATSTTSGILSVPVATQDLALTLIAGTIATVTDSNTTNTGTYRISSISTSGDEISLVKLSGTCATNTGTYTVTVGKNYVAEEANSGGSVYSKYITRKLDFANPSTGFNFRLDVNRPAGSNIKVYYKTSLVGESDDIAENEFTLLDTIIMPVSLDDAFTEVEAEINDIAPYESIIFKIAFTSIESSIVPKCKNLRIIALA